MNQKLELPGIIAHFDLEQGTEDWHRIRWGKVGGVLAKSLLGKPETLINKIAACYLEPFEIDEEGFIDADMQRGKDMEPQARAELSKYIGVELLPCGWLQSTEIPIMGISPDGISANLKIIAEIKCPARDKHTANLLGGEVPADNLQQVLHAFSVNPHLEKAYFLSFRPESEFPMFVRSVTKETIVDIGLTKLVDGEDKNGKKCKRSVPDLKTVGEAVAMLRAAAMILQENVNASIQNLRKI